jgi:hypothetical protein
MIGTCGKLRKVFQNENQVMPPPSYNRLSGLYDSPLRRLLRRAFAETVSQPTITYVNNGIVTDDAADLHFDCESAKQRVAIIVPTYVQRCSLSSLREHLRRIDASIKIACQELSDFQFMLVVALQWSDSDTKQVSITKLLRLTQEWSRDHETPLMGISLSPRSKLLALNSCRALIDAVHIQVVSWIDDDVVLDKHCLSELLKRFDSSFQGIYGGRKITIADSSRFSIWWARRKNRIEPVNLYPHGCCMLMSEREFNGGIPLVYQSDDHYFLLKCLEPEAADPFVRLRVVREAKFFCPTANTPRTILGRIRRNYSNVLRILADAPPSTVRFFLRDLMFTNLRLPRTLVECWSAKYWREMFWHLLKLLFWLWCALPVFVRGALNLPKLPQWYSAPFPMSIRDVNED